MGWVFLEVVVALALAVGDRVVDPAAQAEAGQGRGGAGEGRAPERLNAGRGERSA